MMSSAEHIAVASRSENMASATSLISRIRTKILSFHQKCHSGGKYLHFVVKYWAIYMCLSPGSTSDMFLYLKTTKKPFSIKLNFCSIQ